MARKFCDWWFVSSRFSVATTVAVVLLWALLFSLLLCATHQSSCLIDGDSAILLNGWSCGSLLLVFFLSFSVAVGCGMLFDAVVASIMRKRQPARLSTARHFCVPTMFLIGALCGFLPLAVICAQALPWLKGGLSGSFCFFMLGVSTHNNAFSYVGCFVDGLFFGFYALVVGMAFELLCAKDMRRKNPCRKCAWELWLPGKALLGFAACLLSILGIAIPLVDDGIHRFSDVGWIWAGCQLLAFVLGKVSWNELPGRFAVIFSLIFVIAPCLLTPNFVLDFWDDLLGVLKSVIVVLFS